MINQEPLFSVIIPFKETNDYVRETVEKLQSINHASWELILLPNKPEVSEWIESRISIIPTGKVSPAIKRNIGAKSSKGRILLFLDDDSYPDVELLNIYQNIFEDESIVCAGGPGITPPQNSFFQKISGSVYESLFLGGNPSRYRKFGKCRNVDDWPSVNLAVRKSTFKQVGGFNSIYWPGEDSIFCNDLIRRNFNILMIPEAIVWHHRRRSISQHLKQAKGYGTHRGYFARKFPENSRKLKYFLPTFTLIGLTATILLFLVDKLAKFQLLFIGIYLLAIILGILDNMRRHGFIKSTLSGLLAMATHVTYGIFFVKGFFTQGELRSKLR
jgi:GT2 family glycosyltransferase